MNEPKISYGRYKVLNAVWSTITGRLYYDPIRLLCHDYDVCLDDLVKEGYLDNSKSSYRITEKGQLAVAQYEKEKSVSPNVHQF